MAFWEKRLANVCCELAVGMAREWDDVLAWGPFPEAL